MLSRELRFKPIALSQAASSISQVVATFALAYAGYGYWAIIYATLLAALMKLACLCYFARPPVSFAFRFKVLRSFLSQSAYLMGQRGLWFWVQEADTFLIGRFLGAAALGSYSIAKTLANAPLERAAEVINQISLPAFAAAQDDKAAWLNGFNRLVQISAVLGFPLFWGMATVADGALPLILGGKWQGAILPFTALCLILPLRTAFSLTDAAVIGSGRADIAFLNVAVWAVVITPLLLLGVGYGIGGVAAAWLIGFPIVFLIFMRRISRTFGVHFAQILRPMIVPAIGAACGAGAGVLLALLLAGFQQPVVTFALQVPVFAAVYIGILRSFDREAWTSFIGLVFQVIGRRAPTPLPKQP